MEGEPQQGMQWGKSQAALTFLEARVGGRAGPLSGQHPGGAQFLAVGSQEGAGTLGGKRNPQQVGAGYIMGVHDDRVLIVC